MTTPPTKNQRSERRQRNMVLGEHIDGLIDARAARDGVSVTQAVQRAILVREDILSLAAAPARLVRVTDPELVLPAGCEVIRFAGGY